MNQRLLFFTAILTAGWVRVCEVNAQHVNYSAGDSVRHIQEVDIHANRVQTNVSASKPIQTMTREDIDRLGIHELSDAVKHFAGANVRDYGGIGGMKTVSVRNLGAQHTAVSYDGITISNTQAGQIDIGRFSLDNVENVSLAVGSDDNLMQTARHYASAGVLSINTERPTLTAERTFKLKGSLRTGSFGLFSPNLRYWQRMGDRTTIALDGTFMRADGAYPFTLVNGKNRTHEKRHNSDITSWHGEANLYHTFRDGSRLDTKAYWFYSERGLPGSVILYNKTARERLWDEDFFAQTAYSRQMGRMWKLTGRLKYTHSWNKYEDTDVKYDGGKQTDVSRQDEYYGSFTLGWLPTANFRVSLAEDAFFNLLRSNVNVSANAFPSNPTRFTTITALNAKWMMPRLELDGGLVATFAHERVEFGHQPDDRHRISPYISASLPLPGYEALRLRAMAKGTFRMPTFNDLYYIRMGNTGLRPEKAKEYNIGLTWSAQSLGVVKYLGITVDGFYNDVTDKIVAFPSTYVWKMANFGKVKIHGVDVTLSAETGVAKNVDLVVNAAYSYQRAQDRLRQSPTYKSQLPYTPEHSGNMSLMLKNKWVNVGYSILMQGERWNTTMNKPIYRLEPFWEHTLSLSHTFLFNKWKMDLIATVRNLTNEQYEIIKYYPMPRRSFDITAKFEL